MQTRKVQFIYHPENDRFVANKIICESGFNQNYDISQLSIKKLNNPTNNYWEDTKKVDAIILLVGSTFDRVAPYIYEHDNFLCIKMAVFGIDISSLPNEWGETKKKSKIWLGWHSYVINKSMKDIIKIYNVPNGIDGYNYISKQLPVWIKEANKFAKNGYVS